MQVTIKCEPGLSLDDVALAALLSSKVLLHRDRPFNGDRDIEILDSKAKKLAMLYIREE